MNEDSFGNEIISRRTLLDKRNLKKDNSEKEHSGKSQFWKVKPKKGNYEKDTLAKVDFEKGKTKKRTILKRKHLELMIWKETI